MTADDDERRRRQRTRSVAIGLALGALVLIFYAATIVRLGPNALRKGQMSPPSKVVTPPASTSGKDAVPRPDASSVPKRKDSE